MWSEMYAIEVDEQVVTRAADLAHAWLRRGALRIGRATR
ncbi:twitching motility protein PilT [Mycobacterium tuberculosis]|nr:twitching motility protein PilT [Mycobacterium tuberculosis]